MGRLLRSLLSAAYACIAAQLLVLWICGSAQLPPGSLSIDCGSTSTQSYADSLSITWTPDANLMTQGEALAVKGSVNGNSRDLQSNFDAPLNTTRLFSGNQSKYCYTLSSSAVAPGSFILLRASFWWGDPPLYNPKDGSVFRFKLLVDADEWMDVNLSYSSNFWIFAEMYTRALRDSIDVCLARSAPDGDAPFISALELRPLPSSLSATRLTATINRNFLNSDRADIGGHSGDIRYPADSLDRFWLPSAAPYVLNTTAAIDTSTDQDLPPAQVLQTSYEGTESRSSIGWLIYDADPNRTYYGVIYFAEIDPRVNAAGQRVFDVEVNGEIIAANVDVFAAVGADTSYEIHTIDAIKTDAQGNITFNFVPSSTSLYEPMFAATELFQTSSEAASNGSSPNDVIAIGDLKMSMNLRNYTGDPCLPIGFGYPWIICTTSIGAPSIRAINLSNYLTNGQIPDSINNLTMIEKIFLDGNDLEGSIPNMSDLQNLQILVLNNNRLSGSIPESLATLKNLTVLNLANNNLTGEIPTALLQRQKQSTLSMNLSGNPLCESSTEVICGFQPPPSSNKSKKKVEIIIIVLVLVTVLVCFTICLFRKKLKHLFSSEQHMSNNAIQEEILLHPSPSQDSNLVIKTPLPILSIKEFTFQEIMLATNNFNTQIGQGGFGSVYRGSLQNGNIVAIKVSSASHNQGSKEFMNEVALLSRIYHKNLLGLIGFCNTVNLTLVYEFMSKGSLFDCLHGENARTSPLSWRTRLRILVDAAQGLSYLHFGCRPQIIHRDIKSSNILLNDKLEAKISDFGISKSRNNTDFGAPTTALMGSVGYLDPEYISSMQLTDKVDVYGFGVVIFEVLCGRKPLFTDEHQQQTYLVQWVKPWIDRGVIDNIVDATLHNDYNISSVWKVIDVALACVTFESRERPSMAVVCSELEEAQRMELQSFASDTPSQPTIEMSNDFDSFSLTRVQAR